MRDDLWFVQFKVIFFKESFELPANMRNSIILHHFVVPVAKVIEVGLDFALIRLSYLMKFAADKEIEPGQTVACNES